MVKKIIYVKTITSLWTCRHPKPKLGTEIIHYLTITLCTRAMHFINNNMVPVISGQNSMDAFQGKVIGWDQIPFYIIGYAVMWLFIFTPTMRGKGKTTSTNNILTEAKEA